MTTQCKTLRLNPLLRLPAACRPPLQSHNKTHRHASTSMRAGGRSSEIFGRDAQERVAAGSEEGLHGFEVELLRLAQESDESPAGTKRVEPRVANHGRITEKAVADGTRENVECFGLLTEISELPGKIIDTKRAWPRGEPMASPRIKKLGPDN